MGGRIRVKKVRYQIDYAEHWHTSKVLLDIGNYIDEGSHHLYLSSIVFSVFALEAYLNHIGMKFFKRWDELERLGIKTKINVLSENIGIESKWDRMPLQIINEIVDIRNKIVHGKNDLIIFDEYINEPQDYNKVAKGFMMSEWKEYATKKNAVRIRENLRDLLKTFWERIDTGNEFLFDSGIQTCEVLFERDGNC